MKFFQSRPVQWAIFGLIVIVAAIRAFTVVTPEKHSLTGYDEQMWTSSSIASYHMAFKGFVRSTKDLDNWFATYAWRNKVPVFTGERWQSFNPDTVKFPYDYVTVNEKNQSYSIVVKYDTLKFPRKEFQWYDREMWTFGWKAPNLGKYIMGWAMSTFGPKPDPNAYFSYFIPEQYVDSLQSKKNVPSTKIGSAAFSYAPEEYVLIGRRVNSVFTVLTIVVTILLAWWFLNFWTGVAAGGWLALNTTFMEVNTIVGLDSFAVFFSTAALLGLLITMKLLRRYSGWWKIMLAAAATGCFIGFAVSSKLNAGMLVYVAFAVYAVAAVLLLLHNRYRKTASPKGKPAAAKGWKENIILKGFVSGALIGGLSVMVFIGLNPQVQGDPSGKIRTMQGSIDDYFSRRARIFTQNQLVDRMKAINAELIRLSGEGRVNQNELMQINSRLQQVNAQLNQGLANQPENKQDIFLVKKSGKMYATLQKIEDDMKKYNPEFEAGKGKFMNWVDVKNNWTTAFGLVMSRIAVVQDEGKDTRYYGTFGSLLKFPLNPLDGLLALAGVIFLMLLAYRETRRELFMLPSLVLLIAFAMIVYGNIDFVWQDWPRYMTPVFPLYAIMIGFGIVEGVKLVIDRISRGKQKTAKA